MRMFTNNVPTILDAVLDQIIASLLYISVCLNLIIGTLLAEHKFRLCPILTSFIHETGKISSRLNGSVFLCLIGNCMSIVHLPLS